MNLLIVIFLLALFWTAADGNHLPWYIDILVYTLSVFLGWKIADWMGKQ